MKLRNKKTGEIGIINHFDNQSIVIYPIDENWNAKGDKKYIYNSLAELNEEWCDYEEPEELWFIAHDGSICSSRSSLFTEEWKKLGLTFETKEEAEKAVEKLKAFKRLKDKGFKFDGWTFDDGLKISICTNFDSDGIYDDGKKEIKSDLDLLFGGEE